MGLQTTEEIPYGKTFGPISVQHESRDPRHVIGHMTKDEYTEGPMTKISLSVLEDPARLSEWLQHIHPARNESEQNMEIYTKEDNLYYRALRTILADEEILAWYSRDLAATLGIPDVLSIHVKEDGSLYCPLCRQTFQHPFTLRAHLAFICEHRLANQAGPLDMSTPRRVPAAYSTPEPVLKVSQFGPDRWQREKLSPSVKEKHGLDEELEHAAKKRRISGGDSSGDESTDRNQNIRAKVDERRSPPRVYVDQCSPSSSHQTSPEVSPGPYSGIDLDHMDPRLLGHSRIPDPRNLDPRVPDPRNMDPRFHPMMKSSMIPYLPYPSRPMVDIRVPDLNQEIRQLEASVVQSRMITDRMYMPYPGIKTHNPVVEKLLSTPLNTSPMMPANLIPMNLLQNWCAKCNATFRMTSDLVYHMRSHHKGDAADPVKRRRDEKLKCTICHETFKERHHLTRHMTSHL